MNASLPSLALALLLGSAAGAVLARPQDGSAGAAGTVRFVDLQRCFQEHPPLQGELQRLREEFDGRAKEINAREASVREMKGALDVLERGTDEYARKAYEYETAAMLLDREKKFTLERLQHQRMELYRRAYPAVQRAAAEAGAREGFAAVLVLPDPLEELPQDLQAAVESLQGRAVLWANPAYDVTDLVLEALQEGP